VYRSVAIKVLAPSVAQDAERRSRFEREANAIAALSHPHICTLYDVGSHEETAYFVMELVDGQTLAARFEKGALPVPEALTIASQVADALAAAHRLGIVHRDTKPANISMLTRGVKLLEFDLAKLRATPGPVAFGAGSQTGTATETGTAEGAILGTIQYMAPEQAEGKDADHRADIWARGAVLYEMVTGVRPFTGESAASVVGAILKEPTPTVGERQPAAPLELDRIIAGCLDKSLEDRWHSASDVRRQLRALPVGQMNARRDAAKLVRALQRRSDLDSVSSRHIGG
jgi:eukaryotic-like serine/threonine-protein kinase